ncbi:MAG: TetR/AcrR family transcriptional regulator [Mycobacteriales bacterium]
MQEGLRERRKQRTRRLIGDTAWRLFAERGFERVTVADVARAAEVAEATVFNYFRTKEALVFQGMEAFEAALLEAIRDREPGETPVSALGGFLHGQAGRAALDPATGDVIATTARMVAASPALRVREGEILDGHAQALARLLALDTGTTPDDPEPLAAAHALIGVHRTILQSTRQAALAGLRGDALARRIQDDIARALAVVARGLQDYGRRTVDATGRTG